MKHLKKLSVVLMLTTLFSVSFTSCIDNEVSPVVEAIYAAQADLIAAQANVQNAEATRLEAEAAYLEAQAAAENANAALTLEEVEELRIANDLSQIAVDKAQAEFNVALVGLLAELQEAGAVVALDYALKYRTYANAATNLLDDKADAVEDLAEAQALLNSSYPLYAIEGFEMQVTNAKFQLQLEQDKIDALQALIDDPTSLPSQLTAWKAEKDELIVLIAAKKAEIDAKTAERDNLVAGSNGEDAVRDAFVVKYNGYVSDSLTMSNTIKGYQDNIDDWTTALATYDADLTAAEGALTAAETAYDNAWTALGKEDAAGNTPVFGAYFTIDADEVAIVAGGTKYAAPANLQEEYVNARIDVLDATAELAAYQVDFDALVSTYNNAADQLAAAQLAFDTADYAGDLLTAQTAVNTSLAIGGDFYNAQKAYTDARTAFELAPTGSTVTDGPGLASDVDLWFDTVQFDLGNKGIEDLIATTYMQVTSWRETTFGSGQYIPATFAATKYTPATLATKVTALIADNVNYNIVDNTDIYIWDDLALTMPFDDYNQSGTSTEYDADAHFIPVAVPTRTQIAVPTAAVFVEVESDDDTVTNLSTFNIATNMLGTNNFTGRAFFTAGTGIIGDPYTFEAPLTFGDTDAGYDTAWDGNILTLQVEDALTAQAELWNLKLELFKAQNAFDLGDDVLAAAQEVFDYQKELFDHGAANLAELQGDLDTATTAETDAQTAVDNAWTKLGVEYTLPTTYASQLPKYWVVNATHTAANYDIDGTSGYDADFGGSGSAKALTLNAVIYNSTVAFLKLDDCDAVCLQDKIDVEQHKIDLIQPSLDGILAIIAEMQAQYDIYMATWISGFTVYADLDADLKVKYDTLSFEIFKLNQESYALNAQKDYFAALITATAGMDISGVAGQIATELTLASSDYNVALTALETAEGALATAKASNAYDAAYLVYLQAKVDVLQTRYENASALAAKYKALMDAALLS